MWGSPDEGLQYPNSAVAVGVARRGQSPELRRKWDSQGPVEVGQGERQEGGVGGGLGLGLGARVEDGPCQPENPREKQVWGREDRFLVVTC